MGDAGYTVMLFDGAAREDAAEMAIQTALHRRVDGVVLAATTGPGPVAQLRRAGVAIVAVGASSAMNDVDWVSADDEQIAVDAVSYLIRNGHTNVATIAGPPDGEPGASRLSGYRGALLANEQPLDQARIAVGNWTRDGGAAAMEKLLLTVPQMTAVFCANDLMAIGALDTALAQGLAVPDDIAIVGVDDVDAAALVRPALSSTVRIPSLEIGRTAGTLLLDRLSHGKIAPARHILVQHRLIIRQSA